MATTTANKQYSFDMKLLSNTLSTLVNECHKYYSNEMKWSNTTIYPGQFGYDAMAVSLAYAINEMKQDTSETDIAKLVHDGWCINYVYWRDNKPYDTDKNYKKPFNALGDERRDLCAKQSFDELNKEEQNKDIIIAKFIRSKIM